MLHIIRATAIRNYTIHKRAFPWHFFIGRLLTGIYTALFGYFLFFYLFKQSVNDEFVKFTGSSDYMTFVIVGSSIFVLAIASLMNIGRSLMNELRDGTLDALILSPSSRLGYFIGVFSEQIFRSLLEFTPTLIVGFWLGADYSNVNILSFILTTIIAVLGFFSVGVALSSVMIYTRDTYISQNTLFVSMSLLCGITFPTEYLPSWLQLFSNLFPLTHTMILYRKVTLMNESIAQNMDTIAIIVALSFVYFFIGFYYFLKNERKLLERAFI